MRRVRLFLIAGEPSGDLLGSALISGLRTLCGEGLQVEGVGGRSMAAEGLESRFPMEELTVMGLAEVLPRVPKLLLRVRQTAKAVVEAEPDALITIDSPDFGLRVAARARAQLPDLRVIHYVAPSVWAWRPGRAAKMARHVDHVLALLPFEPPYMQAAGMSCDFVGHPVAAIPQANTEEVAEFRGHLGINGQQPLLLCLPGSRRGEVARLAPVFGEVIRRLRAERPDLAVIVPAAAPVADMLPAVLPPDADGWPRILDPRPLAAKAADMQKRAAFAAARAALAASGTVSLELAAAGTPMVIGYAANRLTEYMIKRLASIDTATLVNLVTKTRNIPEFLFDRCTADLITPAVAHLLDDPAAAEEQRSAGVQAMEILGRGGEPPGLRAARSVLDAIQTDPGGTRTRRRNDQRLSAST